MTGWFANRTRVESWRFFDPPSAAVDPHYTFPANRADLGARVHGRRIDVSGAFAYVRAERLPTDAIGPGGLGTGAFYFAATGLPYSYQVFLSELTLSVHSTDRRLMFTAGRMRHISGAEGDWLSDPVADDAAAPAWLTVRRRRLDGRLIGTFDWSHYQRRFDGARVRLSGRRGYLGAAAFLVTQGGYEESASLTMTRLGVATAAGGLRHDTGETQVFAHLYRDRRAVDIRPDNAERPVSAADVTVWTAGASHVATRRAGSGTVDWMAWGAVQGGDWYGQSQRAWSGAADAGYRWESTPARPWLRAGASYASGDDNPGDDRHATFFPMLQDTRTYAPSMVYAQMNLRDLYAELSAEPHPRAGVRVELHRLALAEPADRWYQGSGATARTGRFFGFSTRPSSGARSLGTALDTMADLRLSRYWSVNAYVGRMWGGDVVRGTFDGDRLFYWYVENAIRFSVRSRE